MKESIAILKSEHRSISAVLHALKSLARMMQSGSQPRFQVLRSMLRYLDEFPERLHHPKEDEFLFARLAQRAPAACVLIDKLQAEHRQGARLIRELERALLFLEEGWPDRVYTFRLAVDAYADFHWKHMRKEERELLPLAERHFTAEDWAAVDAAFSANRDPIAGLREQDYEELFSRIASLAPAPVGLGEPWN